MLSCLISVHSVAVVGFLYRPPIEFIENTYIEFKSTHRRAAPTLPASVDCVCVCVYSESSNKANEIESTDFKIPQPVSAYAEVERK